MKKIVVLLFILIGGISSIGATDACCQHLSPEEFKEKQQTFITEKAGLSADEATKFFPIYFELQDKKRALNDKAWKLLHKGKDGKLTDAEYEEILLEVYDLRVKSDQLDKTYYEKFKKVLSPKKIYMVQRAEMRFHRELVKSANQKKGEEPRRQNAREKK